jgi:hypothetical protein
MERLENRIVTSASECLGGARDGEDSAFRKRERHTEARLDCIMYSHCTPYQADQRKMTFETRMMGFRRDVMIMLELAGIYDVEV